MDRRSLLAILLVTAVAACMPSGAETKAQASRWPTAGWPASTPAAQGIDGAPLQALDQQVRGGAYGNVDRLLVVRNGHLVVNHRYENDYREISRGLVSDIGCGEGCDDPAAIHEFNYYHPDYHPYYQGRDVHSLQSVTKSVTSTVIGVAIARGEIPGPAAPLLSFFGDFDLSRVDARLRTATLDDLLTMRSGIEWHESGRPLNDTNTTIQLEKSPDWIQFTLNQPMDADPGQKWAYNSGGSHLMSGVIKAATGRYVDDYAGEFLFGPLGIDDFHWKKTPKGYPDTEGGLYLEAEQLAKIGYLFLNDGVWDGRRILPETWVAASTTRHVESVNRAGFGYGYQWWLPERGNTPVWTANGFGGQFLIILPEHQMIGVAYAWNVFGGGRSLLIPLLDAMLESVQS